MPQHCDLGPGACTPRAAGSKPAPSPTSHEPNDGPCSHNLSLEACQVARAVACQESKTKSKHPDIGNLHSTECLKRTCWLRSPAILTSPTDVRSNWHAHVSGTANPSPAFLGWNNSLPTLISTSGMSSYCIPGKSLTVHQLFLPSPLQ